MTGDGEWFVYDKSTASVDGDTLSFDIVEKGLEKLEAQRHILKDGYTMAQFSDKDDQPDDEDLSHSALAKRHNAGKAHCCNCGGSLSRGQINQDRIVVTHEGC